MNVPERLNQCWSKVAQKKPLVYHVTNFVAAPYQADLCLAIGASPIMAPSEEEASEMVQAADVVLVNIGTPTAQSMETIRTAMKTAADTGTPVVLDPVGYGATARRIALVDEILQRYPVAIVKGNSAEIALMAGCHGGLRGVDSTGMCRSDNAVFRLARKYGTVVAATGKVDYVSDGNKVLEVHGGSDMMQSITAGGCAVGSLLAAILGASGDALAAAIAGLIAMGIASERAIESGPGSFKTSIIDQLYGMSKTGLGEIEGRLRLQDRIAG
ncbi:hydroxyethylthiazole kinase [Dethiosulfovibrio sp. F2B]|uniref:hydroxyethylthiazole kinase n=1 Tax=Dethiosulfovibrio faecalis TaxID=2720018 RepID=UPI001F4645E6|nr:hydroxyethylthiazole kinase [Dethiosulfovibrio faecalis]MCF4152033.1 hydroxyethylthiazole kinase [Dethiosulfovibrio faecalis]